MQGPIPDSSTLLLLVSALSVAGFAALFVTSFVKISIVLGLLRNAVGVSETPSGMVIAGLSVVLSMYVMYPVARMAWKRAAPAMERMGSQSLPPRERAALLSQTWNDVTEVLSEFLVLNSSEAVRTSLGQSIASRSDQAPPSDSLAVVAPAFLLTEVTEAFRIAFFLFLPFLVVDLLVAAVLMSLGMHMMSPTAISLPFKLMLFAAVEGFTMVSTMLMDAYAYPW